MNKLLALTRIQLKDFFSKYTQQMNIRNKWLGKLMILLPIIIILPMIQVVKMIYDSFAMIGQPELVITYIFVGATLIAFFMAIPLIISIFFYAKDLSLIATLPVKKDTVIFAKLTTVYVYLFGMSVLLFGPAVYFYAFGEGIMLMRLIMGLIAMIMLPVFPMILGTLLIMPFMGFVGGKSKRNLMILVGNLVFLVVIIGFQMVISRATMDPENLMSMLSQEDGLMNIIGQKFPPSIWLTKMVRGSWLDTLMFMGMNLAFILLLKFSSNKLYENALIKYNQQSTSQVKNGKANYSQRSKKSLLIKRHIGIIIHNPTFLLNTVMTMFIPVLLFIIYTATGIMDLETLQNPMLEPYALYIFIGIIVSPSIMGSLSATAITREGGAFWETRALPISVRDNISARVQTTILLNVISTVSLALLTFWILPLGILDIALALIVSMVAIVLFSTVDLFINIERPFLHWTNPTAAVKNNLNIMISLAIRIVFGGIGYLIFLMIGDFSPQVIIAIYGGFMAVLYVISRQVLYGKYAQKFVEMEF